MKLYKIVVGLVFFFPPPSLHILLSGEKLKILVSGSKFTSDLFGLSDLFVL